MADKSTATAINLVPVFMLFFLSALLGCAGPSDITPGNDGLYERTAPYEAAVRDLDLAAKYPSEYRAAYMRAADARSALQQGRNADARRLTDESVSLYRKVLIAFYHDTVKQMADRAQSILKRKEEIDPAYPGRAFRSDLNEISEYDEKIKQYPAALSVQRVLQDLKRALDMSQALDSGFEVNFSTDQCYEKARLELSNAGREMANGLVQEIQNRMDQTFSGQQARVSVKVAGYTDLMGFGPDTPLVRRLLEGVESEVPEKDPERKQFLNLRLSNLRAAELARFLEERMKSEWADRPRTRCEVSFEGRGEETPPGVDPPYPLSDARRRICRIYVEIAPDGY